ncbi:alanine racemase [Paenibacillus sp. PAMC21692]|uniref:alanine racemase n=1 Tax=Paenibacillus sp. PAMC21692 TaxID=2762320 RepID=UPI00164EBB52|nr:alanine racemase [Paenibacillus sp. PAMC21692]QNK60317.1 alanine racemase [Paenibacillus sp. PAMC21692]
MEINQLARPTWVEIDLDAVTNNVREYTQMLEGRAIIIGAIKAHGYGHGLVPLAHHLVSNGIPILAVGSVKDGRKLRKSGITAPIQVFGNSFPQSAHLYAEHNLMPTFYNANDPQLYQAYLREDVPLKIWIKVETGLGRLGVPLEEVETMVAFINNHTPYIIDGIYTHIGARAALGDPSDRAFVDQQWERFEGLATRLKQSGCNIPYFQAASSPAAISMPQTWMNCISIGGGLFSDPEPMIRKIDLHLQNAFKALRSKLISVKNYKKGEQIGVYTLTRDSVFGVAPIGLGDGLSAKNKDNTVLVRGQRCSIRGSVSLEHIRIDVTDVPGVSVGDEVTLIGKQGGEEITVNEICQRLDISSAQLWTSINPSSVPYIFWRDGEIWEIEESE